MKDRFDDAHAHIEQAKSHTVNNTYSWVARSLLQAQVWYRQQDRLEDAKSEALRALEIFEKLGAAKIRGVVELYSGILKRQWKATGRVGSSGEFQKITPRPSPVNVNSPSSARGSPSHVSTNTS
jgi:hypothetical protein